MQTKKASRMQILIVASILGFLVGIGSSLIISNIGGQILFSLWIFFMILLGSLYEPEKDASI